MKTVYLAGLISTEKPASIQWRVEAEFALIGKGFHILSPMRGKENLKATSADGGISTTGNTSRDIILRDYNDIVKSDILLVCLDNFGSERPMVGTLFELAWAWLMNKPVVAFCAASNYLMRNHPFVIQAVAHYFETMPEAVRFVADYYGDRRV